MLQNLKIISELLANLPLFVSTANVVATFRSSTIQSRFATRWGAREQ
jgi:hypothetical protein